MIAYAAYDRRFVRERLAAIGPTHRSGDTVGAIDKAIEILGVSDVASTNRTVHVLSDFPAREWIGADGPTTDQPTAMIAASRRLADVLGDTQTGLPPRACRQRYAGQSRDHRACGWSRRWSA